MKIRIYFRAPARAGPSWQAWVVNQDVFDELPDFFFAPVEFPVHPRIRELKKKFASIIAVLAKLFDKKLYNTQY